MSESESVQVDVDEFGEALVEARDHLSNAVSEILAARLALLRAGVPASHSLTRWLDGSAAQVQLRRERLRGLSIGFAQVRKRHGP